MREFVERIKTDEEFNYGIALLSAAILFIMRVVVTVLCTRGFIINTLAMATGLKIFMYPVTAVAAWEIYGLLVQVMVHYWLRKIFPYWQEIEEDGYKRGYFVIGENDNKKD